MRRITYNFNLEQVLSASEAPNSSEILLKSEPGGGLWHPDGPALAAIREDIDQHPQHLKGTLMNDSLRRTFFEKAKNDEKKVVASFVVANAEGALKTKPKVEENRLNHCSLNYSDILNRDLALITRI